MLQGTVGSHVTHSRLEYLHVAIGIQFAYGENNADPSAKGGIVLWQAIVYDINSIP